VCVHLRGGVGGGDRVSPSVFFSLARERQRERDTRKYLERQRGSETESVIYIFFSVRRTHIIYIDIIGMYLYLSNVYIRIYIYVTYVCMCHVYINSHDTF